VGGQRPRDEDVEHEGGDEGDDGEPHERFCVSDVLERGGGLSRLDELPANEEVAEDPKTNSATQEQPAMRAAVRGDGSATPVVGARWISTPLR
jgi:hypothetical protein